MVSDLGVVSCRWHFESGRWHASDAGRQVPPGPAESASRRRVLPRLTCYRWVCKKENHDKNRISSEEETLLIDLKST